MSERQKDGEYGVFVSDIARGVTDEQLKEEFSKIGDVLEAVVVKNKHSGETKGYGFVKFYHMADAQHAIETPNPPLFKDGITGKPNNNNNSNNKINNNNNNNINNNNNNNNNHYY
ncbi:hypothetical protein ACTFIU_004875 [Dictyostelium citrinum]